jgi:hypothetical protein
LAAWSPCLWPVAVGSEELAVAPANTSAHDLVDCLDSPSAPSCDMP